MAPILASMATDLERLSSQHFKPEDLALSNLWVMNRYGSLWKIKTGLLFKNKQSATKFKHYYFCKYPVAASAFLQDVGKAEFKF